MPAALATRSSDMLQLCETSRANVLGTGVHAVTLSAAVTLITNAVASRQKGYVCVTGVHGVMEAQRDPSLKTILNQALLNTPDGMPMVWVGKVQGLHISRVYGPDLMSALCQASIERHYTHFLYGGKSGVVEQLKSVLLSRYPGIQIAGTYAPPFRALNRQEEDELVRLVSTVRPDFFWVGLSTPKQEKFMGEYINKLDVGVMLGVGAAFDIHTGNLADAPSWVKALGLQWLHRLFQEPRRLWRRYLINVPSFLYKITLQLVGLRTYVVPRYVGTRTFSSPRET